MKFIINFLLTFILCFSFVANAATLNNISYYPNEYGVYVISFEIIGKANYQISENNDEIVLDLIDTNYQVKDKLKKLDGNYLKSISKKSENNDTKLRLQLAKNAEVKDNYSIDHLEYSYVVIRLENKDLIKNDNTIDTEKEYIIMIDPGHGGVDKGTISSFNDVVEKQLTLEYALALKEELLKYPQYKVYLTRDKDVFISPENRLQYAKDKKADIFISLHADFNNDARIRGASIYTLPEEVINQASKNLADEKERQKLLKDKELLADYEQIAGVLINMVYQDTQNSSIRLAKSITDSLTKEIVMLNNAHRNLELKVLKGVDIPAVLVELGYLSNIDDEKQLRSNSYKKLFTYALASGINKYYKELK